MPIFRLSPELMLNTPEVSNGTLGGSGANPNYETVKILREIARKRSLHPVVRDLALKIFQHCQVPSQDYLTEAKCIGQYVQKKLRYVRDIHSVETVYDPLTLIDQIKRGEAQADCDDHATMIASLLLAAGHQPYFRIVKYKDRNGPFNHIYVVVYEKNNNTGRKRLVLDAIIKRKPIGFEVPHIYGEEIKV